MIVELSKRFCYKDNKSTYNPITFIVNCSIDEYSVFKKTIFGYILFQKMRLLKLMMDMKIINLILIFLMKSYSVPKIELGINIIMLALISN